MTDPAPTNPGDVFVTGTRVVAGSPRPGSGGGGSGTGGLNQNELGQEPTEAPTGYWTPQDAEAENQRQKDCAAKKAGDAINQSPFNFAREWFSHIWNRSGSTAGHPPRGGTHEEIQGGAFSAARTEFGISIADISGLIHNHPSTVYCNSVDNHYVREAGFNQYPSINDWAYADAVNTAQGGQNPNNLTLYIVGCDGVTRGFQYSDRAALWPLSVPTYQETSPNIPATLPGLAPDCPESE